MKVYIEEYQYEKYKYKEEYHGYTIRRMGDGLNIYNKNGCYVKRVNSLIIPEAKIKIDEIISNH